MIAYLDASVRWLVTDATTHLTAALSDHYRIKRRFLAILDA